MSSRGVNKVILVGRVGQDPDMRYTNNQSAVVTMSLATSESWKDKNTGEREDRTEWHRVVCFNKLAEIAGQYVKKGSQLFVGGSLRTRKWTDNQGQERYTTEVLANNFQMLDSRSATMDQQSAPQASAPVSEPSAASGSFEDDIPF